MNTPRTTEAQTHQTQDATPEQDPFARAIQTAAGASAALSLPVLCLSIASLAAAVLVWGAWVAPFMSASIVSLIASLAALVLLAAPGIVVLKIQRMLHGLARLPERFTPVRHLVRVDFQARLREELKEAASRGWVAQAKTLAGAYVRAVHELYRAVVGAQDELSRIASVASSVRFVTNAWMCILAGFASIAAALLSLFGFLALIRLTLF
jgi:hypothetical protein